MILKLNLKLFSLATNISYWKFLYYYFTYLSNRYIIIQHLNTYLKEYMIEVLIMFKIRGLENDHVIWGSMRGLQKCMGNGQTLRRTDRRTLQLYDLPGPEGQVNLCFLLGWYKQITNHQHFYEKRYSLRNAPINDWLVCPAGCKAYKDKPQY